MVGEGPGRRREFLDPLDAHGLYGGLHRAECLVLSIGQVFVRTDPSRNPPARRVAFTLERFVRYKGLYSLIGGKPQVERAFERFSEWCGAFPACAGIDDPRALPLHVFDANGEWTALGTQEGDASFSQRFGGPKTRVDDDAKRWARAVEQHGRDELIVSGCALPRGCHWDVTAAKGKVALRTSYEVWQLRERPSDYLNVYPDAHVRHSGTSLSRRVWSAPRPQRRR